MKLIVVADDFGFSEAYNYGVVKAYKEGIVTTLSLMSNMDAAEHAVNLWKKECPDAPLVQHTNFVQGRPVSDPKDIPSLVDENGMFYRSFKWKAEDPEDTKCKGDVYPTYEDLKKETMAQLNRHKELVGHYPNHFEGHSAMTSPMKKAFADIGIELGGIHNMGMGGIVPESDTMYGTCELMILPHSKGMEIISRGTTAEDFLEDRFGILNSPSEITILHFHPGYLDAYVLDNTSLTLPRCRDLQALTDPRVRQWIQDNSIELVNFDAVYKR